MSCLTFILVIFALGWTLLRFAAGRYAPKPRPDETHYAVTSDGWRIAIHRWRARGANPHGEPVLLHHGYSANHKGFDLGVGTPDAPVPSIAHALADRGYDVWACDLRGRADSDRPVPFGERKWSWSVDDYIHRDDPAIVDYILARSAYAQLHWIGHSMGGLLLFCHCGVHGSSRVASGVTVGSGIDYSDTGSYYIPLLRFYPLIRWMKRNHLGLISKISSPMDGRGHTITEEFNYWPSNTAPAAGRAIHAGVINDVSGNVTKQMTTLFEPGGFRSVDDTVRYTDRMSSIEAPILLLGGDRDRQAPPVLIDRTLAQLGDGRHAKAMFGKDYGHRDHYGHFDLLVGLRAETEVFPTIFDWLATHRAKTKESRTATDQPVADDSKVKLTARGRTRKPRDARA